MESFVHKGFCSAYPMVPYGLLDAYMIIQSRGHMYIYTYTYNILVKKKKLYSLA